MVRRHKDAQWTVKTNADGTVSHHDAELSVMMDIRDELKELNKQQARIASLLGCFRVPRMLNDLNTIGKAFRRKERAARKPKAGGRS